MCFLTCFCIVSSLIFSVPLWTLSWAKVKTWSFLIMLSFFFISSAKPFSLSLFWKCQIFSTAVRGVLLYCFLTKIGTESWKQKREVQHHPPKKAVLSVNILLQTVLLHGSIIRKIKFYLQLYFLFAKWTYCLIRWMDANYLVPWFTVGSVLPYICLVVLPTYI